MISLTIKHLSFVGASALAARYPEEQYLPAELNDALLALINSVGVAALNLAIVNTRKVISAGIPIEELESTDELETLEHFTTEYVTRNAIIFLIADMSGLEWGIAETLLGLVEQEVDRAVFNEQTSVDFEGVGVISAGNTAHSYRIELAEALRVPPLKHISVLSGLFDERATGTSTASASSAV